MSAVDNRDRRLRRRRLNDRLLRLGCRLALGLTFSFFMLLAAGVFTAALPALTRTEVRLSVHFEDDLFTPEALADADYHGVLLRSLLSLYPEWQESSREADPTALLSPAAPGLLLTLIKDDPRRIGTTMDLSLPLARRQNLPQPSLQTARLQQLDEDGRLHLVPNLHFFSAVNAPWPEMAGIGGALCASFKVMLLTLLLSLPAAMGAAIYMEEIAAEGRLKRICEYALQGNTDLPPVLYGLTGLALLVHLCGLPGGSPGVAALVLSLVIIPPLIATARSTLAAVPRAMKEAAWALGATRSQTILHHILPAALPSIAVTGLGTLGRAFGECAPLLLLGSMIFVDGGIAIARDNSTSAPLLPVQIFLWSRQPEFLPEAALATAVLVLIPACLHLPALLLRRVRRQREKNSFASETLYLNEEKR